MAGALRSRRVAGAALDVLEEKPPGPSNPIRAADNAVLGSRNASNTLEASARTHREALASPSSRPRGSLRVRRVVVTGARGGIGRAAAAVFTQRSWRVIGVDSREPGLAVDRFERVDPGSDGEVAKLFGRLSGEGPLAALVNNAAIGLDKPLRDTTGDDWKRLMDVNLRSAFQCVREARRFLAAANGAVVNVGSVHAIATSANAAVYAVTKGALCALTRAAALELAADGVRCNAPGAVDTPMLRDRLSRRPRGARGEFPGSGRPDAARLRRLARADRSDHPLPRGRRTDALRDRAGGRRRRDAPARDRVTARTVRAPPALAVAAPFSTMDAKVRAAAEHFRRCS